MDRFSFGSFSADVLVGSRMTGGDYAVLLIEAAPGVEAPAERHDEATRVLFPVDGEIRVAGSGKAHRLRPPDGMVLRAGEAYVIENATDRTARYLLVCQPPNYERFVREFGATASSERPAGAAGHDARALRIAGGRSGIHFFEDAQLPSTLVDSLQERRVIYSMMGAAMDEVLGAGSGAEHFVVARVEAPAGHRTPCHIHPDPICFCAVQGEIEIYDGIFGDWRRLAPGQALHLSGRVRHGTRNGGVAAAHYIIISTTRTRDFYHKFGMARTVAAFLRG